MTQFGLCVGTLIIFGITSWIIILTSWADGGDIPIVAKIYAWVFTVIVAIAIAGLALSWFLSFPGGYPWQTLQQIKDSR